MSSIPSILITVNGKVSYLGSKSTLFSIFHNYWTIGQDISLKLTTIPINDIYFIERDRYYIPLLLNEEWLVNNVENKSDNIQSLHCQLSHIIIEEINACKLKFNTAMEIIYHSNPTLIPMKSFVFESYINQHYKHNKGLDNNKSIIIPTSNHFNQNGQTFNESDYMCYFYNKN